jgi:asparagine synthase (glutamine-hydrolysing)
LKEELEIGTRRASEYLLQLYEEDASFPANLNGRFQGLLVDRARGTAKLFNDRYGMHRVYFHESNDAFYFAVEAKTILAVRPELRVIDQRGLGEFIACGCVLENRTLFQKIYALPPASCWVLGHGALQQKANYFEAASWENQEVLGQEDYYQQLRDVFSQTLPHYFNGHEKIGMSLTGGLDTRMIMAWRRFALGSLPCYSFGGMYRETRNF